MTINSEITKINVLNHELYSDIEVRYCILLCDTATNYHDWENEKMRVSVLFTPESLKEFCPSLKTKEFLMSLDEGLKNEIIYINDIINTDKPYYEIINSMKSEKAAELKEINKGIRNMMENRLEMITDTHHIFAQLNFISQ